MVLHWALQLVLPEFLVKTSLIRSTKRRRDTKGSKKPVTVIVDTSDKTFEIKISDPSASALLFKEGGFEGRSGKAEENQSGQFSISNESSERGKINTIVLRRL